MSCRLLWSCEAFHSKVLHNSQRLARLPVNYSHRTKTEPLIYKQTKHTWLAQHRGCVDNDRERDRVHHTLHPR